MIDNEGLGQIQPSLLEHSVVRPEIRQLEGEELDSVCSLSVPEGSNQQLTLLMKDNPKKAWDVIQALATRDLSGELPVDAESFTYKRNLKESQKLRLSALRLLGQEKQQTLGQPEFDSLLEQTSVLLALEQRKADWLEQSYYPALYY